jgi:transglutaminase-like putative cysteine protease
MVSGNQTTSRVSKEGAFRNTALYAEWKDTKGPRILTYTFKVLRKERVTKDFPKAESPFSNSEYRKELAPTRLANLQGPEKELAGKITAGKNTNQEKAFAIYDWIVENMFRDPNAKGCGLGDVDTLTGSPSSRAGTWSSPPPQAGEPLNYFMYPYAEADGKQLNEDLYGINIGYTIRFKELL